MDNLSLSESLISFYFYGENFWALFERVSLLVYQNSESRYEGVGLLGSNSATLLSSRAFQWLD